MEHIYSYFIKSKRSLSGNLLDDYQVEQDSSSMEHIKQPPQTYIQKKSVVKISCVIVLIIFSGWFILVCSPGNYILHSFCFIFDNDNEIDESIIRDIYYNLDNDSRLNITNETYFLMITIPELNYSIRFDYRFTFISNHLITLEIVQHEDVPRISAFEKRSSWNAYNLSIEFIINSTDPDIHNVSVFPPDNVIYGQLSTYATDNWNLSIRLEEGYVDDKWDTLILQIPHNQRIIVKVDIVDPCPLSVLGLRVLVDRSASLVLHIWEGYTMSRDG